MHIDDVIEIARLLYGADWQRPLARGLGPLHPAGPREAIDDRLVRRWASGERPVPDWIGEAMLELLEERAHQSKAFARVCLDKADEMRAKLDLDLGPAPGM